MPTRERKLKSARRWVCFVLSAVLSLLALGIDTIAETTNAATGTAFVVGSDGYLLTCAHVVGEAKALKVALGKAEYSAAVIRQDLDHDLALLKIEATGLAPLPFGTASTGDEITAMGFPLAGVLGESIKVTGGTVSAVETRGTAQVLQIDAAVNPGNSGGPVLNARGQVVGIVSSKLVGGDIAQVAFAVSATYARQLLAEEGVRGAGLPSATPLDRAALVKRVQSSIGLVTSVPREPSVVRTIASGECCGVAFSQDGKLLACAGGKTGKATTWSVESGDVVDTFTVPDTDENRKALEPPRAQFARVESVEFFENDSVLVDYALVGLFQWDRRNRKTAKLGAAGFWYGSDYSFSSSGHWWMFNSGYLDDDMYLLDRIKGTKRALRRQEYGPAFAFHPKRDVLAVSDPVEQDSAIEKPEEIRLIDPSDLRILQRLTAPITSVDHLQFSPDGTHLLGCGSEFSMIKDGGKAVGFELRGLSLAMIWDIASGKVERTLSKAGSEVTTCCYSRDGTLIATEVRPETKARFDSREPSGVVTTNPNENHSVALWDASSGALLWTLPGSLGCRAQCSFAPSGGLLALVDQSGRSVALWRLP